MSVPEFTTCPRCSHPFVAGFAAKASGLSFVAPDKFNQFAFVDEDLAKAGLTKLLPSKAKYFRSYLCRGCELYLVDYGTVLSRHEAERVAESLAGQS
ncbi:MAG: hypothetical protein K8U57_08955 [Planctomycetes bacterium]|nr:hypothetical protein [Planctomycetota bacterium]